MKIWYYNADRDLSAMVDGIVIAADKGVTDKEAHALMFDPELPEGWGLHPAYGSKPPVDEVH